ncbi:hypothetical protein BKG89_03380 [Rodentibacter caecimuris]|uniref:Uncharacterized protein n=1 Tax=Rodentibacter caecimuris TaxID=1796644 RepID=A0ABX3KY92_9PAST|nr:hypothetical protein BKG89_03380 [Rodentibacter heylii]
MNAITAKEGFWEPLFGFLFNWIDSGLYTKQTILEEKLENTLTKRRRQLPNFPLSTLLICLIIYQTSGVIL